MTIYTIQKNSFDGTPAIDAVAVTPSDTVALPNGPCMQLYIGGTGTVKVTTVAGTTTTFTAVPAGFILPIRASLVFAIGTSATNIVALY